MPEQPADRGRDTVQVFQSDEDGQWYWRRLAPNSRVVAVGGEGYEHRAYAEYIARALCPDLDDYSFETVRAHGKALGPA